MVIGVHQLAALSMNMASQNLHGVVSNVQLKSLATGSYMVKPDHVIKTWMIRIYKLKSSKTDFEKQMCGEYYTTPNVTFPSAGHD